MMLVERGGLITRWRERAARRRSQPPPRPRDEPGKVKPAGALFRLRLDLEASGADQWVGLLLGAGLIAAAAAAGIALQVPIHVSAPLYGAVVGVGGEETDEGLRLVARVRVADGVVVVRLPSHTVCTVGDRIALQKRRTLVRTYYAATQEGCSQPARNLAR
jgi:hypothetical protein